MKPLTKSIRKDIKKLISERGSTAKITNTDIIELLYKYIPESKKNIFSDHECEVLTIMQNQIDYFKYGKGM